MQVKISIKDEEIIKHLEKLSPKQTNGSMKMVAYQDLFLETATENK